MLYSASALMAQRREEHASRKPLENLYGADALFFGKKGRSAPLHPILLE